MASLEFVDPQVGSMFASFGLASYRAQQFETLVIANLQYSLALAHEFANLEQVNESSAKYSSIPMGQVFARLKPLLDDDVLAQQIERAIETRNALTHHYFRHRQGGETMNSLEIADSVEWCRAASKQFKTVSRRLALRRDEQRALFADNPDTYLPRFSSQYQSLQLRENG